MKFSTVVALVVSVNILTGQEWYGIYQLRSYVINLYHSYKISRFILILVLLPQAVTNKAHYEIGNRHEI